MNYKEYFLNIINTHLIKYPTKQDFIYNNENDCLLYNIFNNIDYFFKIFDINIYKSSIKDNIIVLSDIFSSTMDYIFIIDENKQYFKSLNIKT